MLTQQQQQQQSISSPPKSPINKTIINENNSNFMPPSSQKSTVPSKPFNQEPFQYNINNPVLARPNTNQQYQNNYNKNNNDDDINNRMFERNIFNVNKNNNNLEEGGDEKLDASSEFVSIMEMGHETLMKALRSRHRNIQSICMMWSGGHIKVYQKIILYYT